MFVSPRRFQDSVARIAEMAASGGRQLPISPTLSVWCGLDGDRHRAQAFLGGTLEQLYSLPYEEFRHLTYAGSPAEVAEALFAYVEVGCRDFSLLAAAESWEWGVEQAAEVRHRLIEIAGALPAPNQS
jgi:alkanesulfonate monooxygenase SsuD/methylene tetrahydromethanopterin reductase-like flavin-dependent oxidoreductase (luciferase family)